eukprot:CAMPEP_0173084260 /NCGR_PEP_ID=MMETSP1102-20130122/20340_1 /TAXON_ID=49646 /ORGANISM="Geminigera sp., Strain Caron Lab Isolate" /LENGTH=165 /DNA_ID=CAMNT_0013962153 /DNA_START=159 /DNA_END=656 /DNA_ORIENTATION=-
MERLEATRYLPDTSLAPPPGYRCAPSIKYDQVYISPFEPKVYQGYRWPNRIEFLSLKDSGVYEMGHIPGYKGHIPLIRPNNTLAGKTAVGSNFAQQSRASLFATRVAAPQPAATATTHVSQSMSGRTIAGMLSEPRFLISREVGAKRKGVRHSREGATSAPPYIE